MISPIELAKQLISFQTITPNDAGITAFIKALLEQNGFSCMEMEFEEAGYKNVKNLYAVYGDKKPVLCFAGHLDVVPPGDIDSWSTDPFIPTVIADKLFGRGVADMKGAVAAFVSAAINFTKNSPSINGSIAILLTLDEEGIAINGTKKMLEHISTNGSMFDYCIVGEPTSSEVFGDTIKNGRRGSATFKLIVDGVQGHVAYPEKAQNPNHVIVKILNSIVSLKLDEGSEHFAPSNLEVTSIDVGNETHNIIPAKASAIFNIRFSDAHTADTLSDLLMCVCDQYTSSYTLSTVSSADCFINKSEVLENIVKTSIKDVVGIDAKTSTSGGTSDARYISKYCPVVEFGLLNETAHQINEFSSIDSIEKLSSIYYSIIYKTLSAEKKL